MSFSNLKKQSSLGSLTAKLVSQVEKMNKGANGVDDRLWKPEVDKAGNGYAVIRFLPAPDGEDLPWAKLYTHAFQASGGWYIENSLTTLGQKDPVSEHNSQLWNSGVDSDKEVARKQKRKLSYYSNVYVVKDPSNPANEGKVFLFRFGKKIFDKITYVSVFLRLPYRNQHLSSRVVNYALILGLSDQVLLMSSQYTNHQMLGKREYKVLPKANLLRLVQGEI